MSRYKSIKFDQFSDGEQCDVLEPTEKSFEMSNEIDLKNGKIKLAKNVKNSALYALSLYVESPKCSFIYNNALHILGNDIVSDENRIKKINTSGTVSTVHTFSGGGNESLKFFIFRDKAIVSMLDGSYKIQYATLSMSSWTNCNVVGAGFYIKDFIVIDDRLYILCRKIATDENFIYYSDDGINFTLLINLDSEYVYDDFNYLNGYFYLRSWKHTGENELIRISISGEIQEKVIPTKITYKLKTFTFNGCLYFLVDYCFLYRLVGSSLKPVFSFKNKVYFLESSGLVSSISFWDPTDDKIITMNLFERFSRPFNIISALTTVLSLHKNSNNDTFALGYLSEDGKVTIYENKYISPGSIQSQIKKIPEGLAVPKQLILNHKPLTANAWVKVYIKYDQASSWGDAVINSNATNAVRKIYNIPRGTKCSFIQVKIEYGTGNSAETPEDATVEFVYLPVGLLTSR